MNITIIGTGNVTVNLVRAFSKLKQINLQVYGRNTEKLEHLAKQYLCNTVDSLSQINTQADYVILAVSDNSYSEIIAEMPNCKGIVIHTAGSVPISIFENKFKNFGAFYPLQSLSSIKEIDFSNIPICIEASDKNSLNEIHKLAKTISNNTRFMNSEQRQILHIAAVFANNFTNHMYVAAAEILNSYSIPLNVLQPLIMETAQKAFEISPQEAQTGPAKRNDTTTINRHLETLKESPELQNLYNFVSESILKSSNSKKK